MIFNDDELAIILLCTDLLKSKHGNHISNALWDSIAQILFINNKTPKDLFKMSVDDIDSLFSKERYPDILKKVKLDNLGLKITSFLKKTTQIAIALADLENRGIKVTTRASANYPKLIKQKLKRKSPAILYYCGDLSLVGQKALGVVGSRNLENDIDAIEYTNTLVSKAIDCGYAIVTGGAKGIDITAEKAAYEHGGKTIIYVSDSLCKKITTPIVRRNIIDGNTVYISQVNPEKSFSGISAMERNKLIYASSKYTLVVAAQYVQVENKNTGKLEISDSKGGTWAGAIESNKLNLCDLLVRTSNSSKLEGNEELIKRVNCKCVDESAAYSPESFDDIIELSSFNHVNKEREPIKPPKQMDLFPL